MNTIQIFEKFWFTNIFNIPPLWIMIVSMFLGFISLIVCPKQIRTIFIKNNTIDVGFYSSYNWTITFTILFPIFLSVINSTFQSLKTTITELVKSGFLNISSNENIYQIINSTLTKSDIFWIILILIGTGILNFLDFSVYFFDTDKKNNETKNKDWTVAFQNWNKITISKKKNLLFNAYMYLYQWFALFIIFIVIYKFIKIIIFFVSVFNHSNTHILFNLNFIDIYQQFGLKSVNPILINFLILIVLLFSYFMIIRFVHVQRNVKWKFLPRSIVYLTGLIIIGIVISFYTVIQDNIQKKKDDQVRTFLIKKASLEKKLNKKTISFEHYFKINEKIKSIDSDINLVLNQKIISLDNSLYYFFILLYLIQIRLIIFPPKTWLDALKDILRDNV